MLKRCDAHRRRCLEAGEVIEITSFGGLAPVEKTAGTADELLRLDADYETFRSKADPEGLLAENNEEDLGQLFQTACRLLIREAVLPDELDALLETRFGGGRSYAPLHARISLINVRQGAEETHVCFRALTKTNPTAYLARVNAALTASGIDRNLGFRRLFIIRRDPPPKSPKCREATQALIKAGGRQLAPDPDDLASLWALYMLDQDPPARFEEWLLSRRPASRLKIMRQALPELDQARPRAPEARDRPPAREGSGPGLIFGRSLDPASEVRSVSAPLDSLRSHVLICAGTGAGKTVLLRRLVETAALSGVPVLAVDTAGTLAGLAEPWPDPPGSWSAADRLLAGRFPEKTEVVIWDPLGQTGLPLKLPLLPDPKLAADPAEWAEWALGLLEDALLKGRAGKIKKMRLVLAAVLEQFARRPQGGPRELARLLADPPEDAARRARGGRKLAQEMAGLLGAFLDADPLSGEQEKHVPERPLRPRPGRGPNQDIGGRPVPGPQPAAPGFSRRPPGGHGRRLGRWPE